jgi:hypothetical protein
MTRGRPKMSEEVKATPVKWRPASKQATLKAKSGYTAKWVRNDPSDIARYKSEGFIIMKPDDNVGPYKEAPLDVNDGTAVSNQIRFRDCIAMMLPNDLVEARKEYFKNENAAVMASVIKKTDDSVKKLGGQTYTPKGMAGKIVID